MLLCHTCIYMHTNTQTRLLFLQPASLQSRRQRPITITGPDLHHKRQEGPDPVAPWSDQKPTGECKEQVEGMPRLYLNTDLQALSRGQKSAAAHPEDSQSSETLQSPGSPDLTLAAPFLAAGRPGPLWGGTDDLGCERHERVKKTEVTEVRTSLLLLFNGLYAFHQILLSFCVWVQRLILRDHAEIRTDLLMDLQKTEHHKLIPQPILSGNDR